MAFSIGLDIGGSKIAAALFDAQGVELIQNTVPTPKDYESFLTACAALVKQMDEKSGGNASIGMGIAGMIDPEAGSVFAPNIPCLKAHSLRADCEKLFRRPVRLANDADCAALSEAIDGAGKGYRTVFGLIMGTGSGGGLIINGRIHEGPHGLAGEIGHLPLPFREAADGPVVACECGQHGCIDKSISGPALGRLYKEMTGRDVSDPRHVVTSLRDDKIDGEKVLDRFYTTVAKAMVTVIHAFDPEIIVVSGGLNSLQGMYEAVPQRWGRYALAKKLKTKFVPSVHGPKSGLRGAARVGVIGS